MSKTNVKILKRGLKRIALALLITASFALAVAGFIGVAFTSGYLAVLLFLASVLVLAIAFVLLYGYGMNRPPHYERKDENNAYDIPV